MKGQGTLLLVLISSLILSYTGLILWLCLHAGFVKLAESGHPPPYRLGDKSGIEISFTAFAALGTLLMPYGGYAIALDFDSIYQV